jgi:hypothetical protein
VQRHAEAGGCPLRSGKSYGFALKSNLAGGVHSLDRRLEHLLVWVGHRATLPSLANFGVLD